MERSQRDLPHPTFAVCAALVFIKVLAATGENQKVDMIKAHSSASSAANGVGPRGQSGTRLVLV